MYSEGPTESTDEEGSEKPGLGFDELPKVPERTSSK